MTIHARALRDIRDGTWDQARAMYVAGLSKDAKGRTIASAPAIPHLLEYIWEHTYGCGTGESYDVIDNLYQTFGDLGITGSWYLDLRTVKLDDKLPGLLKEKIVACLMHDGNLIGVVSDMDVIGNELNLCVDDVWVRFEIPGLYLGYHQIKNLIQDVDVGVNPIRIRLKAIK